MSKTRRGRRTDGADNYPTPKWAIERFLEEWPEFGKMGTRWLEPCAGDGVIIDAVNHHLNVPGVIEWTAADIRDTSTAIHKAGAPVHDIWIGDFFGLDVFSPERNGGRRWDVAIMNPPFRLAFDFIDRCLLLADVVVVMQRMNYCGSADRNSFFRGCLPDLYVIPDRVSYTGNGKADSVENAWHVWGLHDAAPRWKVLRTTPLETRKAAHERTTKARGDLVTTLDNLFAEAE